MGEIKWVWDYQLLDHNPKREDSTARHGVVQVIPFHLHHAALQTLRAENARLRQVEGERDQWIAANTKEPINEPVTYQALAGARFVAKRAFDELVKARSDLSALRQLVEVHTKQLTELTIIPIGCSREQELRWTQSIKDLRATLDATTPATLEQPSPLKSVHGSATGGILPKGGDGE